MTQMGLDYLKHRENVRHNIATEGVEQQKADATTANVAISQQQADAATSQAQTAAYKASFTERETAAKEKSSQASYITAQAKADEVDIKQQAQDWKEEIEQGRLDFDQWKMAFDSLPETRKAMVGNQLYNELSNEQGRYYGDSAADALSGAQGMGALVATKILNLLANSKYVR